MQALPDSAMSLCISEMGGTEGRDGEPGVQGQLYLNIGLHNGVLLRTVVDQVTGDLSDTRTRYIGSRPVKLFRVTMQVNIVIRGENAELITGPVFTAKGRIRYGLFLDIWAVFGLYLAFKVSIPKK